MIKENGTYYLDLDNLENKIKGNEKVVILCSPHNPSGRCGVNMSLKILLIFVRDMISF